MSGADCVKMLVEILAVDIEDRNAYATLVIRYMQKPIQALQYSKIPVITKYLRTPVEVVKIF